MKQNSAIGALLITLLLSLTVAINEGMYLVRQKISTQALASKNIHQTAENQKRKKDIQALKENQATITATVSRLNSSFVTEGETMNFPALRQVGIKVTQDATNPNSKDTIRYKFSSSEVEFHRFVPAVTTLENQHQLLRFVSLTLNNPAPFRTTATALKIEGAFEMRKTHTNP